MADTKITALTALTAADPANDVIPIVDVSDTTMAASGTTKKISVNNILGASGTATLASATITGNLTVQTNALFVNSANNRVGIGTVTPARPLDIVGSFQSSAGWALVGSPAGLGGTTRYIGGAGGTDSWFFNALTGGNHLWAFGEVEAMRLNSTGLGIGGSAVAKLSVTGDILAPSFNTNTTYTIGIQDAQSNAFTAGKRGNLKIQSSSAIGTLNQMGGGDLTLSAGNSFSSSAGFEGSVFINAGYNLASASLVSGSVIISTNNTARLTVDATGNVGIGVTPSAGKGCLQLSSGINFPATQVASSDVNTLDDYEEGTFTPTIVGTSTAGTGTYTTQAGRYTKIGNRVFCEMFIAWTAHTGTGNMDINTNLPFTSNSSVFYSAASIGDTSGITLTASNTLSAVIVANSTLIRFRQIPVGGGNSNPVPIDTAGDVTLSISYIV